MRHDLGIGVILISPFVASAVGAFAILVVMRMVFRRVRSSRFVANPPITEAGTYVCVLALLILFL